MKIRLKKHSCPSISIFCLLFGYLAIGSSASLCVEFPTYKKCLVQNLNKPRKDTSDIAIGKVSITYADVELYQELSTPDPFPYPSGNVIRQLKVGDIVDLLEIYPNDSESRKFTYKIKTAEGTIGYMMGYYKIIELYGDRGALMSIHLSRPYEYEGDIKMVDEDIAKYRNFIKQYPQSQYKFEALLNIVGLHLYTFQLRLSVNEKYSRFQEIKEIYKTIFKEVIKPELSGQVDRICDEILSNYEKRILLSRDIDDFNIESFKSLFFNTLIDKVIRSSR